MIRCNSLEQRVIFKRYYIAIKHVDFEGLMGSIPILILLVKAKECMYFL